MIDIVGSGGGGGKGGGGSARTPVETPDSLHNISFATFVDAISNGPIAGPVHSGSPLRDVYLDGTPVQNENGSLNFQNVQFEFRPGTIDQTYIPGFPSSSSLTSVGVPVTQSNPWTQLITNTQLDAVRITVGFPIIMETIDSGRNAGDRVGSVVQYAVDISTDGGSYVTVLSDVVDGKSVNGYQRTSRIELPNASTGWTIRVRRITPDPSSSLIQNAMQMVAYAGVIDGKFNYPMTALAGLKIDAEQFSAIPAVAYHMRGRIILVPTNYDPESRTYSGVWNGQFKSAYSNNPAWVYYDMIISNLYGLGDRVDASQIDRYALYQIGVWCDQLVSDGMGGTEPRFVINAYIQAQADALKVLNDLTSAFRGMSYWANGQIYTAADMPSDPVYLYTNANVANGRFEYTGSDVNTRNTVALVSYNDPADFGRAKVETVNDRDGILQYGIRQTEVVAFGCTSRSQAQRVGLYILYTSRMETGGVSFAVGLDGVIPQPGAIIKIADQNRAGRRIGGRIKSATIDTVTLDRDPEFGTDAVLTVILPDGSSIERDVLSISGRVITVTQNFDAIPVTQSVWAVTSPDLSVQYARVITVGEIDGVTFNVSCVFHDPQKYTAIDNNVRLEPLPVSVVPPRVQTAPENVAITEHYTFHQGVTRHYAEISFDAPNDDNTARYDIHWRRDSSDWVQIPRTGTRTATIEDIYSGLYQVRVRAINPLGVASLWAYSEPTELEGGVTEPPALTSLVSTGEVFAIRLDWVYPVTPNIISKVELRASQNNVFANGYLLTEVAYPATSYTMYGLSNSAEFWFWARLIDKNGTPGAWYPINTGAGVYGQPSQDPSAILDYLEEQIGEGQLAPGLIEEISEDVAEGIVGEVIEDITGPLTGDTEIEGIWYVGDGEEEGTNVGTVTLVTVVNDGDYQLAKQVSTLFAQNETFSAAIQTLQQTMVDEVGAVAQSVDTLAVQVGENEAVLTQTSETLATLEGELSSTWQVKTQVRTDGRVVQAGVALGASIGEGGVGRSEILLMADTIAFVNSLNGSLHAPFIFDVPSDTVYLNTAFIADGTITNAKIGNIIESIGYNPSTGIGWRIDKTGGANFSNVTIRDGSGAVIMSSGAGISYDVLSNKPTSLGDINTGQNNKLTGIQAGATVGATFGTNISGQITSSNVSTYIANAAIRTAQIGDLQVSTLKIGDNAVTIPASSYASGSVTYGGTWTTVASVTITSEGSPISVIASLNANVTASSSGFRTGYFRIVCDSTNDVVTEYSLSMATPSVGSDATRSYIIPLLARYTRGVGTAQFSVQAMQGSGGSSTASNRFIQVSEVKK